MTAFLLFVGLGVGLGLVFLVEQRDDRVMSLEELGGRFEEWIVGQVPEVRRAKKKKRPALLDADDRRHIFAESYRNMRSALFYAAVPAERPKTLLVTSAIPHEGKSTVAANLARAMAFAGCRVLLVDGDLRRGLLHELFELPQEPGFADLLSNGGELSHFAIPIPLGPEVSGQLHLLPRGKPVGNSGELFLGAGCDRVLAQIRKQYDSAIIDSIPVFAADDTTSLAPKVDGVLLVVRGSYAGSRTIRLAMELLYERQAKIMGLVFNRANSASRSYEYYKYADYYRSAGKGH